MPTPPRQPPEESLAAGLITKPIKTQPMSSLPQARQRSGVRRPIRSLGLTLLLSGAGALVAVSLWTSVVLIFRPHPPRWLAAYLPGWTQGWGEMPVQSIADIDAELEPQQRYRGDLINLSSASYDVQLENLRLLPIFEERSPCTQGCEAIVELRLYELHRQEKDVEQLQLLHQLRVQGPTEAEVLKSLSPGDTDTPGSTYQLPLEALKPLYEQGLPGGWFTLTGRWQTQGSPVLYGQILYVNPQTLQIHSLLNWESPPGRLPAWHNFDSEGHPELLVNRSYGLEPHYRLYAISNLHAINATTRLQEVALTPLALPNGHPDQPYRNALFLAQQELWSASESRLKQIKAQVADQWTLDLERQLRLVSLHARFSRNQADRDWSQPSQKLLTLLLDGQWKPALEFIEGSQSGYRRAVLPLLERDSTRLWQRLTAALRVDTSQKEARLWGALLLMAKENETAAINWLTQNPKDQPQKDRLQDEFEAIAQKVTAPEPQPAFPVAIAAQAEPTPPAKPTPHPAPVAPQPIAQSPPLNGLFGVATPLQSLDPAAWYLPTAEANWQLSSEQQWYAITLRRGHRRQQWQSLPSPPQTGSPAAIAAFLQSLGLEAPSNLQLVNARSGEWVATVQVKAVRWRDNAPTLLASGPFPPTPTPLIAALPNQWDSLVARSSQSLGSLLQTRPEIRDRLLTTLNNHLGFDPAQLTTTLRQQANRIPPLATSRQITVTPSTDPAILLSISPDLSPYLGIPNTYQTPVTLIMTPQGELLYSSLWSGSSQQLVGRITPPSGTTALVTLDGDRPNLLPQAPQTRQFR